MIGIVKGFTIAKNKDSDVDRVLLQVEFIAPDSNGNGGDTKTIELMTQSGEDLNPGNNSRVMILEDSESYKLAIATSDDLTPALNPGEKEIYSTDSPVTQKLAKVKLNASSEVVLNDGTDYAVAFDDLKTAFDQLQSDFDNFVTTIYNLHNHPTAPVGPVSVPSVTGSTSTADIDPAKVEKVRLP